MKWQYEQADLLAPTDRKPPDAVVWWIVWGLSAVQSRLSALVYLPQARWFCRRWKSRYYNYLYTGECLGILTLFVILSATFPSPAWIAWGWLPLWRIVEILVWYTKMLLDRGHDLMITVERNLLFLVANMIEMVLALTFLLALGDLGQPESLRAALSALTLNGLSYEGGLATGVLILGTISGLVLIAAGLALIIGIIGGRFREGGRPYEGATLPPKPGQGDFYEDRERLMPRA